MKNLLITLMLVSPFSFADWGDVYYCQMTNSSGITLEGVRTDYKLEKFQFKLDKTKNAMVFGKGGYFNNEITELRENFTWPRQESWLANDPYSITYFNEGKLLYSYVGKSGMVSISADCDKF